MKKFLIPILIVGCGALVVGYFLQRASGPSRVSRPEQLVGIVLDEAAPIADRERAIFNLIASDPVGGKERLREALAKSKVVEVRAAAISALTEADDFASMPKFIELLSDPSEMIRARANMGVKRILGRDFGFDPSGPVDARNRLIVAIRQDYDRMKQNPHPKYR